jgi:DNA-binding CsgD family transcriptional regulator
LPVLAAYLLSHHDPQSQFALTAREREILALVAQGDTDVDIAEALFISVRTVRSHLDRIRDKTGRRRRADLTRLAYEQRAIDRGGSAEA